MTSSLRTGAWLAALWLLALPCGVRAQQHAAPGATSAAAEARADALFAKGKEQLGQQNYAAACPLLAESFALDPATGTQLALALCYERAGDVERAIREYRGAAARAQQEGRADREQAATQRADELEAGLTTEPSVQPEPEREPARARAVPEVADPQPAARTGGPSAGQWIGIGVAGAGVVALGVATGLAVHAADLNADSDAGCDGDLCTAGARRTRLDAVTAGNLSSLMVVSGAALLCTGAAIFFSAEPERDGGYSLLPWLTPNAAGATARARF